MNKFAISQSACRKIKPKLKFVLQKDEFDRIILVNRSVKPNYPNWVRKIMYPKLENIGPTKYDILLEVERWFHKDHKDQAQIKIKDVFIYLRGGAGANLKTYMGIRDLEEIQKKGSIFFRKYFQGKIIYGWKGVVLNNFGHQFVPYIYDTGGTEGTIILNWSWLGHDWRDRDPVVRLGSLRTCSLRT